MRICPAAITEETSGDSEDCIVININVPDNPDSNNSGNTSQNPKVKPKSFIAYGNLDRVRNNNLITKLPPTILRNVSSRSITAFPQILTKSGECFSN